MLKKRFFLLLCLLFLTVIYYRRKRDSSTPSSPVSTIQNVALRPITGMDPILLEDVDAIQFVSRVYEGLYTYHYLKRPLELVPLLADGFPVISKDGLVYTFKIKKGVFFQDDPCFPGGKGRELKASDFVFSLKRVVDPKHIVPYASFIDGKIKGLDLWKTSLDYNQPVEGLKALDEYTLSITLTHPYPQLLNILAMWIGFVVPKEAVNHYGAEFLNHPVGTGPFALPKGFNPKAKKVEFVRNETFKDLYFPDQASPEYQHMLSYAGRKLPIIDKITTHIITEEQPRWLKMQKGELDLIPIESGSALSLSIIDQDKIAPVYQEKGLALHQSPGASTELFCFNHKHELFSKNPDLCKAMAMAFNKEVYCCLFYKYTDIIAQSILPPLFVGDGQSVRNPYPYDVERAKKCLAQAGFPNGEGLPIITLDTRMEQAFKHKADFFAKCMGEIGIRVKVITNVWPELRNKIFVKKDTMMHALTWNADYPDASTMLAVVSDPNLIGLNYKNEHFNRLFSKAFQTSDAKVRSLLYAELNQMVADEVPLICCVHIPKPFVHGEWVENFVFSPFNFSSEQYIALNTSKKNSTV